MSFAAAANVITQTGTDASLSGLTGVTGVTVTTLGGVTKYSLNSSTSMVVSGTLTIDPRVNFLEILKDGDTTLRVSSTGVMTIGAILAYAQASQYTTGMAISMVGRSTQPYTGSIKNDGIFNWYGATIDAAGGFRAIAGSSTTIRDGVFVSRLTQSGILQGNQIFFEGGTCDIIGLTKTITGAMTFDNASVGIVGTTTITNLKKVYSTGYVSADYRVASPNASIPFVTITEFSPIQQCICEPNTALAYLLDCSPIYTSPQTLKRRDAYGTVMEQGQIEAYKTCKGTVTFGGSPVLGAKIYWKDINNGARGTAAATAWGRTYTADRVYTATSDASGLFTLNVMEAAWYTTNVAAGTTDSAVPPDRRLETGEFITAKAFTYLYSPTSLRFKGDLLGASAVTSPQSLDASITEAAKETVDAYPTIGTPQKFYDRAKSYLYDNFAGETATMVTRVGSKVFLGAYNLVVDATAGTVFALSGGTITIKETVFVGDVETTGTVTLLNGATIQGIVTSSAGSTDFISVTGLVGAYLGLTDNVGAMADYQAAVTGTYTYSIPAGSTGPWKLCLRRQGYAPRSVTLTLGGTTHAVDGTLVKRINFDGSDAYTGTTSSLVSVAFNSPSAGQCRIDIGDGQVPAQVVYNTVCDAFVTSSGVCFGLDNVFQVDPIGFELYYLSSNLKLRRKLVGDLGAGVQGVVSQGDLAPIDESNGYVRVFSAPNALAKQDVRDSLLLAPTIGASVIAGSTDATLTAIDAKTTNLPALPASTTNITAGTITTVTNLTNAPTAGDLTATMKASVTTAATAATPTIADTAGTATLLSRVTGAVLLASNYTAPATPTNVTDARDAVIAALPAAAPTAAANATAARSELAVELARIDVATSTRNATAPLDSTATQAAAAAAITAAALATAASLAAAKAVLDAQETKAQADARQAALIAEHDATQSAIAGLNDFDPAADIVARVTLVDTTTANTDMRGTNGAVTSLAGIATAANVTAAKDAVIAALPDAPLDSTATQAAAAAAITAAALATHADAGTIFDGVKRASGFKKVTGSLPT